MMENGASMVLNELNDLGLQEIFDADPRPTFIIDLDPDVPLDVHSIHPIFCNAALRLHERLFEAVARKDHALIATHDFAVPDDSKYTDFRDWATGSTKFDDSKDVFPLSFLYEDLLWTGSTVRRRWRIISGNLLWRENATVVNLSSGLPSEVSTGGLRAERSSAINDKFATASHKTSVIKSDEIRGSNSTTTPLERQLALKPFGHVKTSVESSSETGHSTESKTSLELASPDKAVIDWTAAEPVGIMTEHITFARSIDWGSTPLGRMRDWSPELRQIANLVMNDPHPAALFWGSELTMLYNSAYRREVAGRKHPRLMGTGFSGPFAEIWDSIAPIISDCARTGISVRRDNDYLQLERHGLLEETFFSWSFTPLYGSGKTILGFFNAPFEVTSSILSQRRLKTINTLGEKLSHSTSVKQFWQNVLSGLEDNVYDVPFALLYSVGENEDGDQSSVSSGSTISLKMCYLEGALGLPPGHIAAPQQLDLKRSREGFIPSFREAMRTREPKLLRTTDGTLPEALLEEVQWRGFDDPCREAIIFPVRPTNGDSVLGFLLVGVNPRRPYDEEYKVFTSMLHRQLATSLASVMLFEDEVRRSRHAAEEAALKQQQLNQALALQSSRMRRMTEMSPLGMFLLSPDGVMIEANDRYFEMTGLSRETMAEFTWMSCVKDTSLHVVDGAWERLTEDKLPWSGEVQFIESSLHNLDGEPIDYWVLSSAQPEIAADGSLLSVMGSITDISHLKWAQGLQNLRLQEAEETRRQQNEFYDITNHELRNPLSAILHCSEVILSSLEQHHKKSTIPSREIVDDCVDAAMTISLCVQHQKTIVDDILTMSKLDSNLLLLTPVPAQPLDVVKRCVEMFATELQAKDISITFSQHGSMKELNVDWIMMDPSRVLQILINLITNAIKFTAGSAKRNLVVTIGASLEAPLVSLNTVDFEYIPPKTLSSSSSFEKDLGSGEIIYLRCKVVDTGCGLTKEEKDILFERFRQASPRTHAQYGGSGLGLFISRQIVELHGGRIGVASKAGEGSTFGFFITTKRSSAPLGIQSPEHRLPMQQPGSAKSLHQKAAQTAKPESTMTKLNSEKLAFDFKSLTILVVEDNKVNQKVLVNQLKRAGATVSAADDGVEALEYLEQTHFRKPGGKSLSLVLSDLEMPNMDGLTCIRLIRQMERDGKISRHVPVIAVTANVRDEQLAAARASGMDDVVSKPFPMAELFKKIEVVLAATNPALAYPKV